MDVSLPGRRGDMPVYVAVPDGEGPWPAVLVVSDALGMTIDLRKQMDWLAGEGYLAAAPDLFYWGGRMRCLFSTMRQALAGEGSVFDDFETARQWLVNYQDSSGRVGVGGFCFGGGFALLLAGKGGFDVAGSTYSSLTRDVLTSLARSCPVVGSHRAHKKLEKEPAEIAEVLWANSVPYDIEVSANDGHSFGNDHLDGTVPKWSLILGKMTTSEPQAPAVQDSRRRILSFFDAHMAR